MLFKQLKYQMPLIAIKFKFLLKILIYKKYFSILKFIFIYIILKRVLLKILKCIKQLYKF